MAGPKIEIDSKGGSAIIQFGDKNALAVSTTSTNDNVIAQAFKNENLQGFDIAPWGVNNDFPTKMLKDVRPSTIVLPTINRLARLFYNGGVYFKRVVGFNDDGSKITEQVDPQTFQKIQRFLDVTNFNMYLYDWAVNWFTYFNVMPTIIMNDANTEVINIDIHKSHTCRWSTQNQNTGRIDNCWISEDWDLLGESGLEQIEKLKKQIKVLPVADASYAPELTILQNHHKRWILRTPGPSQGTKFYGLAPWDSIRSSGWLDVSKLIPKFKKSLMENQMTVKYHIQISMKYWEWKFTGFSKKTDKEKEDCMRIELERFLKCTQGTDNAGSVLITAMYHDPITQKEFPGWKIEPMENNFKGGEMLEDSQESAKHILSAMEADPEAFGIIPGKGGESGSGSGKRTAVDIMLSGFLPYHHMAYKPLIVAREINKWGNDIQFFPKMIVPTVTSNGGQVTTMNA